MLELVYSEKFLEHETGRHPECNERLVETTRFLREKGFKSMQEPGKIREEDVFLVHSEALISELKRLTKEKTSHGGNIFNANTLDIALLACGAGLRAAELSSKGFAFSLARPPGHHAGKGFFGGFCYLNNVAFAVRSMQKKGISRAMVVDFDLHHGNGTQDIFCHDESVFYLSLHQNPAFTFPGTGFPSENSRHVRNVPLEQGTTDGQYLKLFEKHFSQCFDEFKPGLLGISAGFDIFCADSVVGNSLAVKKHETFRRIGEIIRTKTSSAGTPCFAVLEGGYSLQHLPVNVLNFLTAFQ